MKNCIFITLLCTAFVCGNADVDGTSPRARLDSPEVHRVRAVVQALYKQVITRHPIGLPTGPDKLAIRRFLSRNLIYKFEAARACETDLSRRHSGGAGKPPIPWLETGLFSGEAEEALPAAAVITDVVHQADGSFLATVRLTYKESFETYGRPPNPKNTFHWQVGVVVVSEGKDFKVDDVVFYKEGSSENEWRLSQKLSKRCSNGRWVG